MNALTAQTTREEFGASQTNALQLESAATALSAQSKAAVEARYIMAMRNRRNWDQVRADILKECRRPSFAQNQSAYYRKPIGKGVEGLGIRFAEVGLRCMTNVLIDTMTTYEDQLKEIIRVSLTDLESNLTYNLDIRVSKTVERSKPSDDGSYLAMRLNSFNKPVYTVPASDDDLLNKRGALISKATRTLALRIIPGDIQDEAEQTIKRIRLDKAAEDPDAERKRIADAFSEISVSPAMLAEFLEHDLGACSPEQLIDLRAIWGAIRDGETTWKSVMENKAENAASGSNAAAPVQQPKSRSAKATPAAEKTTNQTSTVTQETGQTAKPISDSALRVLKTKMENAAVTENDLQARFGFDLDGVTTANYNEIVQWLADPAQ